MALVVEDGTGLANAESYISEADADTYITEHLRDGNTYRTAWVAASSANKEIALRQATDWLDITFAQSWQGQRVNETQALAWPRYGVVDYDGFAIDSDVVPVSIQEACAEMAARGVGEDLFADISSPSGAVKRKRSKVGPLETETEYAGSAEQAKAYTKAAQMIAELLTGGGGTGQLSIERS